LADDLGQLRFHLTNYARSNRHSSPEFNLDQTYFYIISCKLRLWVVAAGSNGVYIRSVRRSCSLWLPYSGCGSTRWKNQVCAGVGQRAKSSHYEKSPCMFWRIKSLPAQDYDAVSQLHVAYRLDGCGFGCYVAVQTSKHLL